MPTITQLPAEQRPREKLVEKGAQSLSDAELIAIFLRTGVQGASAIDVGRNLILKYGSLTELGRLDAKELSTAKGLGIAKASQLLACFELGARVAKEQLKKEPLNDCEKTAAFLDSILGHRTTETLLVLALDAKLNLIRYQEVSHGTVTSTSAHPRDVLRPVIMQQATGFILAHNHPSGNPAPSAADRLFTTELKKAADIMQVNFHDHIIIGKKSERHDSYYSFTKQGHI